MRLLILTASFKRTYKKLVKRNAQLQEHLEAVLVKMEQDVFHPSLGTHKLSGTLSGLWACSCGYDCRVIFAIEVDPQTDSEIILLIDIGKHDEVY